MLFSIIIPVQRINSYIFETCSKLKELDNKNFEVLIYPDDIEENHDEMEKQLGAKIIPSGKVSPAIKRDMGAKRAKGDILAFIDDDAYPRKDWLTNASRHFGNPNVAAVGGPAITPESDSFLQRVSGAIFLSRIGGGFPERYRPIGTIREVDDWPSVNLMVRKDMFEKVGGFNSAYWPGEDTKFCLDIIKAGGKIIYDPDVFVWHHRRGGLLKHLNQIGQYGLHRGFFAKRFPETSRRLKYFIPSFFVIFLSAGMASFFIHNNFFNGLFYAGIGVYIIALIIALFQIQSKEKKFAVSLVSLFYIFLTHIWYGIRFLQGYLFTKELKSKLRKVSE
ncbi:MAG TPA: glycosyl transferase [Nitrospinae bacterium]|nr:glycosyl transferase [Nitrospinota bacterium]